MPPNHFIPLWFVSSYGAQRAGTKLLGMRSREKHWQLGCPKIAESWGCPVSRQHRWPHRTKGGLEGGKKKKKKSGRPGGSKQIFALAEAFAPLSAGGASKWGCEHPHGAARQLTATPRGWGQPGGPGCAASCLKASPGFLLTPPCPPPEGRFGSGGIRHLLLHITAQRGAGLRAVPPDRAPALSSSATAPPGLVGLLWPPCEAAPWHRSSQQRPRAASAQAMTAPRSGAF